MLFKCVGRDYFLCAVCCVQKLERLLKYEFANKLTNKNS
jgi:hypothetical protein